MQVRQQNSTISDEVQVGVVRQALAEHERLVHWVVRRQCLGGLPYVEAVQTGRIALWRAIEGYDQARGYRFSTYAVPAIERAVWRAVEVERRGGIALDGPAQAQPATLEELQQQELEQRALRELVAQLPQRLAVVVRAHYGLDGCAPETFGAIGARLGVTRQRVQQLHVEALLWLADPAHSLSLRQRRERNTVSDYRSYLARRRAWQRRGRGKR
jgi:RNA polymerase sigma factor (sigma-70 family)